MMKLRLDILIEEKPDLIIAFEFDTLYAFKNFLEDWLKHAVLRRLKAKITLETK